MINFIGTLLEVKTNIFNQEWLSTNNITNIFAVAMYDIETVNTLLAELGIKPVFVEENPNEHLIFEQSYLLITAFLFQKTLYSFSEEDAEKIRMMMRIYNNE